MKRRAFTLIELLVVMGIIAILVGLISAAAFRALVKVEEVRTRNEISQLSEAVVNFQTKFGVDYIPSQIRLLDSGAYDLSGNNQLDFDSYQYLKRVWPRLSFPVDWNNNGNVTDDVTLSGDQCLVFFLGGIQAGGGCIGFSTDGTNPANLAGDRVMPFYEFKSERLAVGANGYFSCLDPYGLQPYAYFSSYKSRNGYSRYGASDCTNLGVSPYVQSTAPIVTFWNAESFQIVSAGRDRAFGPGGLWATGVSVPVAERDDMANFSETFLGN